MTSEKKIKANQQNAKKSTGPKDTSRSRLNAISHGFFSKEALITDGPGKEDVAQFSEFSKGLREDLAPQGESEEIVVDQIISLYWRSKRVVKFETAATRSQSNSAVQQWEQRQKELWERQRNLGNRSWHSVEELAHKADEAAKDLAALDENDPLEARPSLYIAVFETAEKSFGIDVAAFLRLKNAWFDQNFYTKRDVQRIIEQACLKKVVSKEKFWIFVRTTWTHIADQRRAEYQQRTMTLERVQLLACLPSDANLAKSQRQEAHLSRLIDKKFDRLQRMQAARLRA